MLQSIINTIFMKYKQNLYILYINKCCENCWLYFTISYIEWLKNNYVQTYNYLKNNLNILFSNQLLYKVYVIHYKFKFLNVR